MGALRLVADAVAPPPQIPCIMEAKAIVELLEEPEFQVPYRLPASPASVNVSAHRAI